MPNPSSTNKKLRLRFKYSLRGFILFTFIVCGFLGYWINSAREQAKSVAYIKELGGHVYYEYNALENGTGIDYEKSKVNQWKYFPVPQSWKSWLGDDFEWNVTSVKINSDSNDVIKDLDVSRLSGLKGLKILNIGQKIQVANCEEIKYLQNLETLTSWGDFLEEDISSISNLKSLKLLDISCPNVKTLKPMENLTNLESLYLWCPKTKNISALGKMKNLAHLYLGCELVQDLTPLKSLDKLETIMIIDSQVNDISPILHLKKVRSIYIGNSHIPKSQQDQYINSFPELIIKFESNIQDQSRTSNSIK